MDFVIIGAGAIGGVVGARLAQAGHSVTLVARGEHLKAVQNRGLRIESPDAVATLQVRAVGDLDGVDWSVPQVALVTLKSHQLPAVLSDLARLAPPQTPVVSLQNGVANEPALLRLFPRVYGVNVNLPASFLEPGVVQAWCTPVTGLLDIGRYPHGVDDVAVEVAAALRTATFDSHPVEHIMRWKYRKLLTNLRNAVDATCGKSEGYDELGARVVAEGETALAAAGHEAASKDEDRERRGDLLQLGSIGERNHSGNSTWQSLERGTGDVESDYLNGEIVLLGRLFGVPTPANEAVQQLVRELATAGRRPRSVTATDVLAQLDS